MISYYDIRDAKTAMQHLQSKVVRGRKLDIHYSIPKDNPSEKDQNQGTLVVFNLDPCTTDGELLQIFGQFGEIKEIRATPNKKHHKFIEFYDVRHAEKAMKCLNKTEIKVTIIHQFYLFVLKATHTCHFSTFISLLDLRPFPLFLGFFRVLLIYLVFILQGKKIKIEPSRPGGGVRKTPVHGHQHHLGLHSGVPSTFADHQGDDSLPQPQVKVQLIPKY